MSATTAADRVFLNQVMPRVLTHARVHFGDIRDAQVREDLLQEVLFSCLIWTRFLLRRQQDSRQGPSALSERGVPDVQARPRADHSKCHNVPLPRARSRRALRVNGIPALFEELHKIIADDAATPPDEQAAFRIDFSQWLRTLSEPKRLIAWELILDPKVLVVMRKFGMTRKRLRQFRRELHREWQQFHGEKP